MRNIELELKIAEEKCCNITIRDMQEMFDAIMKNPEYIPSFLKEMYEDLNEEFLQSIIIKTVTDIAFFSAMIALRRVNNMEIPNNL